MKFIGQKHQIKAKRLAGTERHNNMLLQMPIKKTINTKHTYSEAKKQIDRRSEKQNDKVIL